MSSYIAYAEVDRRHVPRKTLDMTANVPAWCQELGIRQKVDVRFARPLRANEPEVGVVYRHPGSVRGWIPTELEYHGVWLTAPTMYLVVGWADRRTVAHELKHLAQMQRQSVTRSWDRAMREQDALEWSERLVPFQPGHVRSPQDTRPYLRHGPPVTVAAPRPTPPPVRRLPAPIRRMQRPPVPLGLDYNPAVPIDIRNRLRYSKYEYRGAPVRLLPPPLDRGALAQVRGSLRRLDWRRVDPRSAVMLRELRAVVDRIAA